MRCESVHIWTSTKIANFAEILRILLRLFVGQLRIFVGQLRVRFFGVQEYVLLRKNCVKVAYFHFGAFFTDL